MAKFSKTQRFVLDNYEDGEFAHCETMEDVENAGDGLLTFLMSELSEGENCLSVKDAFNRLSTIARQVSDLITDFEEGYSEE